MVLLLSLLLFGVLFVHDYHASKEPVTDISRGEYGKGSISRIFSVVIGGKRQQKEVTVSVGEREYTADKMPEVFARAEETLRTAVLGENKSLDEVRSDLDLITRIPGEPIDVAWEISRYDLVNIYGELNKEALKSETEGVLIDLTAKLSYREIPEWEELVSFSARLFPPALTGEEALLQKVSDAAKAADENSRQEPEVKLPDTVEGQAVTWHVPMDYRAWYVLASGPVFLILLVLLSKQKERQKEEARERQMMSDYPEVMNKLALLIGAGMTIPAAWAKIVADYEARKEQSGTRYAYEEMAAAVYEMQSGVTELESYERFGKRAKAKAYRRLSALLVQNLKKGTKGLTGLLKQEAADAFEERKAAAKRRGEEAGTKLLAPMFLMLGMVLVIVIIPAFLSIRM